MNYKNIKIRVKSPEESELVQKFLFTKGCSWPTSEQEVLYVQQPHLFVNSSQHLSWGDDDRYFDKHNYREVEVIPTVSLQIKVKRMTKEQIEEALGYKIEIVG